MDVNVHYIKLPLPDGYKLDLSPSWQEADLGVYEYFAKNLGSFLRGRGFGKGENTNLGNLFDDWRAAKIDDMTNRNV